MWLKIQAGASAEVQKVETKRDGERERAGESESNEDENAAQRRPAHDNGWVKYPGELMRKRGQVIAGAAGK